MKKKAKMEKKNKETEGKITVDNKREMKREPRSNKEKTYRENLKGNRGEEATETWS